MSYQARPLSRREAKEVTRRRILYEALLLLDREGEGALTPSALSRAAGIAQSTFYVHFRDRDDLLEELADWLTVGRNRAVREARRKAGEAPRSPNRVREAFRVSLESMVAEPTLFRVTARVSQEHSSLGQALRRLQDEDRRSLMADLVRYGYRASTEEERRSVEIVADAFAGVSSALAAGILEGRYVIDEALDVIMMLVRGLTPLIDRRFSELVTADGADG